MTLTINSTEHIELIHHYQIVPKIINTDSEYQRFLVVSETLLSKRTSRTIAETEMLMLLVKLIEDYEEETYSFSEWMNVEPHKFLQHLIEAKEVKQSDVAQAIGLDRGRMSAIVNGKRAISKDVAKKLGEYFNTSPAAFI